MGEPMRAEADAELREACSDIESRTAEYARSCQQELRFERDPDKLSELRAELARMRQERASVLLSMTARSALTRAGVRAKSIALLLCAEGSEPTPELELAQSLARDLIRGVA